ncbi:MAG: thiamine pyrophosphate-binding protein, partial [Actinobacteria bacterium]
PSVVPDVAIRADARSFLDELICEMRGEPLNTGDWVAAIHRWRDAYPVDVAEYEDESDGMNSYHFTRLLSERMPDDAVFVLDTGSCFHVHAQAFKVKFGQRHIITGGLSTMGFMPGVMGAAAANGRDVYCVTGDGSLQMNLQELATIAHYDLPAKLIVFNNAGYLLIRLTQGNFLEGRLIGESEATGVGFPDLERVAMTYGIHFVRITGETDFDRGVADLIEHSGPVICEVITPSSQLLVPRVSSRQLEDGTMVSMPYDDMFPFLPRDEYESNQIK